MSDRKIPVRLTITTQSVPALSFRWPWRPYQKRVLDVIQYHLDDEKLHVVAAPGAGKTTLGLEVFRRLNKPALALSPTRSIRDQWITRLRDFVSEDAQWPAKWISSDLDQPAFLTTTTYQALQTRYRQQKELSQRKPAM